MSTAVFPALNGLAWDISRTVNWDTTIQSAVSGFETRFAAKPFPKYEWKFSFEFLRQGALLGQSFTELFTLIGFYNLRQGQLDSFLYQDADDNAVIGQQIGVGDGSTKTFQMLRTLGGFAEPILAPNIVSAVYVDGVLKTLGTDYSISAWGSATPGIVTFVTAPANTKLVTADFSFYWPCRFNTDATEFNKMMTSLYEAKQIDIVSLYN